MNTITMKTNIKSKKVPGKFSIIYDYKLDEYRKKAQQFDKMKNMFEMMLQVQDDVIEENEDYAELIINKLKNIIKEKDDEILEYCETVNQLEAENADKDCDLLEYEELNNLYGDEIIKQDEEIAMLKKQKEKKVKKVIKKIDICKGKNLNGQPCKYQGKYNGYCKRHQHQHQGQVQPQAEVKRCVAYRYDYSIKGRPNVKICNGKCESGSDFCKFHNTDVTLDNYHKKSCFIHPTTGKIMTSRKAFVGCHFNTQNADTRLFNVTKKYEYLGRSDKKYTTADGVKFDNQPTFADNYCDIDKVILSVNDTIEDMNLIVDVYETDSDSDSEEDFDIPPQYNSQIDGDNNKEDYPKSIYQKKFNINESDDTDSDGDIDGYIDSDSEEDFDL